MDKNSHGEVKAFNPAAQAGKADEVNPLRTPKMLKGYDSTEDYNPFYFWPDKVSLKENPGTGRAFIVTNGCFFEIGMSLKDAVQFVEDGRAYNESLKK